MCRPRNDRSPAIRLHVWLETDEGLFFGAGRAYLLEGIDRYGSLKRAAEHMGMSYRAAWGKIKATEEHIGIKLVERDAGKKCGYRLTEQGRLLVAQYKVWRRRIESYALHTANDVFPFTTRSRSKSSNHPPPFP